MRATTRQPGTKRIALCGCAWRRAGCSSPIYLSAGTSSFVKHEYRHTMISRAHRGRGARGARANDDYVVMRVHGCVCADRSRSDFTWSPAATAVVHAGCRHPSTSTIHSWHTPIAQNMPRGAPLGL